LLKAFSLEKKTFFAPYHHQTMKDALEMWAAEHDFTVALVQPNVPSISVTFMQKKL